jgi:ABC-type transport system substrate-binding protein
MFSSKIRYFFLVVVIGVAAFSPSFLIATPPVKAQDNTITIGSTDLPASLDPASANSFLAWEILGHLYTGLTRQIPGTLEYELAVADGYELSEDGLTHRFTIRDDAVFSDGTPITAAHFAYGIQRVLSLDYNPAIALKAMGLSVQVTEDEVLEMTTNRPIPYFRQLVALPAFFPVLESDFPASEANPFVTSLTGNGPYRLVGRDVGDYVELQANPVYQFGPPPKTEHITLRQYENTETLRLAVVRHEIDMAWRDVSLPDAITTAETTEGLTLVNMPSSRIWYLTLNRKFDYVDDPVLRQSVLMTLNRERITEEYFGGYLSPAYSLVPPQLTDSYAPLWSAPANITTAIANMQDAGYRESRFNQANFVMTSTYLGYGNFYANVLVDIVRDTRPMRMLTITAATGIDLATFMDALTSGDTNAALFPWTPIVMHPDAYLRPLLHSSGPLAFENRYASNEMDALLDRAAREADPARQAALYREAQEKIVEAYAIVPLWQDTLAVLAWENIGGIMIEPNFFLRYDQLERQ